MIKMRQVGSKPSDKGKTCTSCGHDISKSVALFDMCFQTPEENGIIITLCDKCVSEVFDKTLKARCRVDGAVKTPQQMRIINGRKQAENAKKWKEEQKWIDKMKERFSGND